MSIGESVISTSDRLDDALDIDAFDLPIVDHGAPAAEGTALDVSRNGVVRLPPAQKEQPPVKRCEHRRLVVHGLLERLLANEIAVRVS
jgi:hypothetical protein